MCKIEVTLWNIYYIVMTILSLLQLSKFDFTIFYMHCKENKQLLTYMINIYWR